MVDDRYDAGDERTPGEALDALMAENARLRAALTRTEQDPSEQEFGHCPTCGTPCTIEDATASPTGQAEVYWPRNPTVRQYAGAQRALRLTLTKLGEAQAELGEALDALGEAQAALVAVKAYLESEDGPIWALYDEGEIGNYEDRPLTWEEVMEKVRDISVPVADLETPFAAEAGSFTVLRLYRQVQAAASPSAAT